MIVPIRNLFYLTADIDANKKHTLAGGHEIYISEPIIGEASKLKFSEYDRCVQIAKIAYCPATITKEFTYNVKLEKGDTVIVHHFAIQKDNFDKYGEEILYRCYYHNIFAVIRDSHITPLHDYLLCTPVYESEETCKTKSGLWLKSEPDLIPQRATIKYISQSGKEKGLNAGDVVVFQKDSDYELVINGEKLWRMSANRILAKVS